MDLEKFRWTLGQHPIAYMSAEFGLDDRLPIYSGGLGMLAGDIIREASDLELPFVGVGLLYREGYFQQMIDANGQAEEYPAMDVTDAPINLVIDTHGAAIKITIPVEDHLLHFQIWEYVEGDVSIFLLDTDVPENTAAHRLITRRLYGGDRQTRILQEIILGIGGVRALQALHIHPSIYHLNEGHSAFAIFEIAYHYMREYKMTFRQAYEYGRNKIVFTNHTLVPAGNELFQAADVRNYLQCYTDDLQLPIQDVLDEGAVPHKPELFSMSNLAMRMASRVNGVSKLHAKLAKQFWPEYKVAGITNGIHMPTWVSPDLKAQSRHFDVNVVSNMANTALWRLHQMAKYRLMDEVNYRTGKQLKQGHLIVTWARRFASYKRPEILFEDIERLKSIVFHAHTPVQFIMAGKAHPADAEGHAHIRHIVQAIHDNGLDDGFIFVPNYNMKLADVLVSGSDIWLNTPWRGQEACGTSGMKAAANGVLQCSVSDGWVDEVDLRQVGWELPNEGTAEFIYQFLEGEIVNMYYERDQHNVPNAWVERMKTTIAMVWQQFSSRRMVSEYIDILYRPTLEQESQEKHYHNWRQRYRTKQI